MNKNCSINGCKVDAPLENTVISVGLQRQYCDEHLKAYKEMKGK